MKTFIPVVTMYIITSNFQIVETVGKVIDKWKLWNRGESFGMGQYSCDRTLSSNGDVQRSRNE